ncbi:MAG: LCP family protein [Chloroflexota bacterium]|nr:LCP family protein [Chloroflexota bacterium]
MTTKEQATADSRPIFDIVMSALLALFLIGGLLASLYLHQALRTFVMESQLPIFPSVASASEELPPIPESGLSVSAEGSSVDSSVADSSTVDSASPSESTGSLPSTVDPQPVDTNVSPLVADNEQVSAPPRATERLTVLVMGIDRREGEEGPWRTDSMILISIDPESETVGMLSFPRDLLITLPDYGFGERRDRINTAFFYGDFYDYPGGGAALAKQAIRRNFGIEVDRHLVMDFDGFRRVIDHVGGIEIDVPERLVDYEYPTEDYGVMTVRFEAGEQMMDGERALIYSRTRKSTSDFARAERQQEVVMALRDRVLSLDIIPSLTPKNLAALVTTLNDSIMTDLTPDEVLAFAQVARDIEERDIHRALIDHTMIRPYYTRDNAEVLIPDWDQVIPLIKETFEMELLATARQAPLPPPLPTATATRRPRPTSTPVVDQVSEPQVTTTPVLDEGVEPQVTPTPALDEVPEPQVTATPVPDEVAEPQVTATPAPEEGTDLQASPEPTVAPTEEESSQ